MTEGGRAAYAQRFNRHAGRAVFNDCEFGGVRIVHRLCHHLDEIELPGGPVGAAQIVMDTHADGAGQKVHVYLFVINTGDITVMVERQAVAFIFQKLFLRTQACLDGTGFLCLPHVVNSITHGGNAGDKDDFKSLPAAGDDLRGDLFPVQIKNADKTTAFGYGNEGRDWSDPVFASLQGIVDEQGRPLDEGGVHQGGNRAHTRAVFL